MICEYDLLINVWTNNYSRVMIPGRNRKCVFSVPFQLIPVFISLESGAGQHGVMHALDN